MFLTGVYHVTSHSFATNPMVLKKKQFQNAALPSIGPAMEHFSPGPGGIDDTMIHILGLSPGPGCQSPRGLQVFLVGDPELNLDLPLGGGTTQCTSRTF